LSAADIRDCPDFCVSKNGTVPFAARCATFIMIDTKILTAPILTYHQPSERRNQGCAWRAMNDSPNPEVSNENNLMDWKSPLPLSVRLVPGREAITDRQTYAQKCNEKCKWFTCSRTSSRNCICKSLSAFELHKWRRRDSNPRPLACKASALPVELRPRVFDNSCQFSLVF
jgi:hypothetical protein